MKYLKKFWLVAICLTGNLWSAEPPLEHAYLEAAFKLLQTARSSFIGNIPLSRADVQNKLWQWFKAANPGKTVVDFHRTCHAAINFLYTWNASNRNPETAIIFLNTLSDEHLAECPKPAAFKDYANKILSPGVLHLQRSLATYSLTEAFAKESMPGNKIANFSMFFRQFYAEHILFHFLNIWPQFINYLRVSPAAHIVIKRESFDYNRQTYLIKTFSNGSIAIELATDSMSSSGGSAATDPSSRPPAS